MVNSMTPAAACAGSVPRATNSATDPASTTPIPPGVTATAVNSRPSANAASIVAVSVTTPVSCRQTRNSKKYRTK